ncbi:hypothetical protein [Pseudomonas aeruginosa]|uniref:hypothetical protein n=1 Tax=Pseudomonas aeruginosa TaxID=287 RepID=UPI001F0936DA|nr:hypothetical protein [Pseudomonas aeruginosa]
MPAILQVRPQRDHQWQQYGLELAHGPDIGKTSEQDPGVQFMKTTDEGRKIGKSELIAKKSSQGD